MATPTVIIDEPQAPQQRGANEAGPLAEGIETNPAADKGKRTTKGALIIVSLLIVAAVVGGLSVFLVRRNDANASPGTVSTADGGSAASGTTRGADVDAAPVDTDVSASGGTTADDAGAADATPAGDAATTAPAAGGDASATDTTAATGGDSGAAAGTGADTAAAANGATAAPVTPAATDATATTVPAAANVTAPAPAPVPAAPQAAPFLIDATSGTFGEVMDFPIIPVAVATLSSGKVLTWAAYVKDDYDREGRFILGGGGSGVTQAAIFDPMTNTVDAFEVANTEHDMFCPGISMLFNGDLIITGGQNADKTTIFKAATETWEPAEDMHISRGYGSSVTLADGNVFVLGGSWSGPKENAKNAEIFITETGQWSLLPGIIAEKILTKDVEGTYRADNYGWFFSWKQRSIFHAGPSVAMHWFDVAGQGSVTDAGDRPSPDSANGLAVMYAEGKIITAGGSTAFGKGEYPGHGDAVVIELGEAYGEVVTRVVAPLNMPRVYTYGIAMPDGKVLVQGGAAVPHEFSDSAAIRQPEMWDPETEEFTLLEGEHKTARTYHSSAILMKDGRIFTGGGGLCGGCVSNHLDAEIYEPAYLFGADGALATRPTITLSAATVTNGGTFTVTSATELAMVSFIRLSTATHSTNTDQRRLELCGRDTVPCSASPITLTVPADQGVAVPGNWWVFGVDAAGVPSIGELMAVTPAA